jgi:hypothetical protein
MKKTKNINLASQFPNIFRIITENKYYKSILGSKKAFYALSGFMFFVTIVLAAGTMIASLSLYRNVSSLLQLTNNRRELISKLNFWTSISDKYEGYKDAYFQIATLEYKLGDINKAKQANLKALLLDPNFGDAKKLEVLLDKD